MSFLKVLLSKQCRRQSIQIRGAKSKSGGPKFLLILTLKNLAVYYAITSINNSLMQSKIILIGVTSQNCFFCSISVIISNKVLFISVRGSGEALQALSSGVRGGFPEAKAFLDFT